MPTYPTTIPPLLPHQVQGASGSPPVGSANTATITPTIVGMRVDCVFNGSPVRSCQWGWGDGWSQTSVDHTAGHTYLTAGTYTVMVSNGRQNGTVDVTVPGAGGREEGKAKQGKGSGRGAHD